MEVDDLSLTEILNPNSSKNVYLTTKKDSEVKYATKVVDKTKYNPYIPALSRGILSSSVSFHPWNTHSHSFLF